MKLAYGASQLLFTAYTMTRGFICAQMEGLVSAACIYLSETCTHVCVNCMAGSHWMYINPSSGLSTFLTGDHSYGYQGELTWPDGAARAWKM